MNGAVAHATHFRRWSDGLPATTTPTYHALLLTVGIQGYAVSDDDPDR